MRNSDNGVLNHLRRVIERSVSLDREICRQAAGIQWEFTSSPDSVHYDSGYMEVETGEGPPQPGDRVAVVLAPALKKRGRYNGEAFENEYLLLKMNITCVPVLYGTGSMKHSMHR